MFPGSIPLVALETVARVALREYRELGIASYLGEDRGGGNLAVQAIAAQV